MDHLHCLHRSHAHSIGCPSIESSKRGVGGADLFVVAALLTLAAMLVHLATPTSMHSPRRHAAHPLDSVPGGAVVASVKPGWRISLRSRPNGRSVGVLGSHTVYGGPLTLPVVRRVKAAPGALAFGRVRLKLEADLSRQLLRVWSHGRVIRRIPVGVGRAGTGTPTGHFSVTDKMPGANMGPYYGCCLLALSADQPNPPPGWTGGARIAIHGGAYGAVSAGCLHAARADLRYLMRTVPLGTQIVIHA